MDTDPMTDKINYFIFESSTNEVDNSIGMLKKGNLGFKSNDLEGANKIQILLYTPSYNGSDSQEITYRFDKKPAQSSRWGGIRSGKGFWTKGSKADSFVKDIMSHKKLLMQWRTWPSGIETLSFDLQDLKKEIRTAKAQGCDFKF